MSFFALPLILAVALLSHTPASAVQTVPYKMNFQGRLTDASGTPKPNGTYNIRFRIYNAASSVVWTEDRLVSASQGVTVTNGLFTVQLGSVTPLDPALFNSATTNQGSMTLEVELPTPATATSSSPSWTEGAMTPRSPIATSAYAFNSDTIDGIDGTQLARTDAANSFSSSQTFNGGVTIQGTSSTAMIIQKAAASDVLLTVDSNSNLIKVGNSMAVTSGDVTLMILDSSTSSVVPTGQAGAMYYDSTTNKFKCYTTSWTNCDGTGRTRTVTLAPEFPGAVLRASGSNNNGTMTSDLASGLTAGQGYKHNYYQWTTRRATAQSYDIAVNVGIPSDYSGSLGGLKVWTYSTDTTNATGTVQVQDGTGTTCYASPVSVTPSSASTWQQITVGAMSGCTFSANDIVTITVRMIAASSAIFQVGEVSYTYTN